MFRKIHYTVLAGIALLLSACAKEQVNKEVNNGKQTCIEYIASDPELTCFRAALDRIGLAGDAAYIKKGPFSFFASTDAAFARAGINVQAINNYDKDSLKKIIYGQILSGRLGSATVAGFYKLNALCLDSTFKPVLSRNYYGLFLNGTRTLLSTDLGDGVVHKMENVIFPGTSNLWETVKANKDLSMLAAAIERSVPLPGQPSFRLNYKMILETGLLESGWIASTVLCPTDAAFHKLGYKNTADIQQLSDEAIGTLLRMHIIQGYFFTSDYFMSGALIPGSPVLKVGSNIIYPKIIQANIKASNGVAHLVDQVILP